MEIFKSGSVWEEKYGYCRALKAGNIIYVSGTTSGLDKDGEVVGKGSAYEQSKRCFEIIENAIKQLAPECGMHSLVRTRLFVTDISLADEFMRAHKEALRDHTCTTALLQISKLIHKDMLIEIEAEAYVK